MAYRASLKLAFLLENRCEMHPFTVAPRILCAFNRNAKDLGKGGAKLERYQHEGVTALLQLVCTPEICRDMFVAR